MIELKMFSSSFIVFSFNFLGELIEISNLLFTSIFYFILILICIYLYKQEGYIFKLFNKLFVFIQNLSIKNIGNDKFTPVLFFLFINIGILNTLRCFYFPAVNSFVVFPILYTSIVFFLGLFYGIRENGIKFFWNLVPHSVPLVLKPLLMVIETIILFTKPVTLCARLLLNISVGHIVIHSLYEIVESFGDLSLITLPIFIAINFIEIGVGLLQAYLFTIFASLFFSTCTNKH